METPICLNPEAPLFIPSPPHDPYLPSYILEIPTQEFHFPMINLNFPPPPTFPAYPPPLYHQNYTHYCSIPLPPPLLPPPSPPKLLISNTHKLNILPYLPKLVPPPLLLPPSPPHQRQPPFYTDLILPNSYPPPSQSPTMDFYTIPSSVTALPVHEALTPMTSGPRFPKKKGIVPRSSSRKKEQPPPEEKEYINNDEPPRRLVDRIFRQRKVGGSHKFVMRAKKKSEKRENEIIPLKEEEEKTTVMIKNIPNQFTREMVMRFLDQHCNVVNGRGDQDLDSDEGEEREGNIVSAYDFLYLPIDFGSRLNKGYAFVNFTHPEAVCKFYDTFNGKSWNLFKSPKIIQIVCAKIEGKEALVSHFEGSNFHCESDEFLPVWFDPPRDGLGESVKLHPVGNRHTPKS